MKTYFLAVALGGVVLATFVVIGYYMFGEQWTMSGFPVISLLTGVICWVFAKWFQQGE